jgi:hypothetical protein
MYYEKKKSCYYEFFLSHPPSEASLLARGDASLLLRKASGREVD